MSNKDNVADLVRTVENVEDILKYAQRDLGECVRQLPEITDANPVEWPSNMSLRQLFDDLMLAYGKPDTEYTGNQQRKLTELVNVLASKNIDTVDDLIDRLILGE
jgi:hypothetical protein